ncbi:hypothetical protein F4801DRAFT_529228 [Xylaria longipes]|nr:hypothetical protein F4801DRAFT_529228 [Xylaria longipes]
MATNTTPSSNNADEQTAVPFKDTKELLLYLYADLARLSRVASPDIILHPFHDRSHPLEGIAAAQAHEEALIASTGGTLAMDVESVIANAHFGVVMGVLRARSGHSSQQDLAVPFCGLWRFDARGRPVEHWENAAVEPRVMARWLEAARGDGC